MIYDGGIKTRMKRHRRYSMVALLMVFIFVLTSCSNDSKKTEEEPVATASPVAEEIEKEDKVTIKGTPLNVNESVFALEEFTEDPGDTIDSLYFYDDKTLLVVLKDEKGMSQIYFYNIEDGTLSGGTKINYEPYLDQALFCDNGTMFLGTSWANSFYYLDENLNVIYDSKQMTESYSSMAASKEGTYFYYLDSKDRNLYKYTIATKEKEKVMTVSKEYENLAIRQMTEDGKYIIASYSDSKGNLQTAFLQPDEQKLLPIEGIGSEIVTAQETVYLTNSEQTSKGYLEYFAIDNPRVLHTFYFDNKAEGNNFYVDPDQGNMVSIKNNIDDKEEPNVIKFQLYDLNKGLLERSATVSRKELFTYAGYEEEGGDPVNDWFFYTPSYYGFSPNNKVAFFTYFVNDKTRVMLWDMTKDSEKALTQSGTAFYTDTEITEEDNDKYVEQLNEKYDVTIYIRNNVVKFFPDFAVNALYNEQTTNEALKEVEKLLSRFPTGFFKDMNYGSINGLEIYLCGALVQGSENGIQNPGGFSLQYRGKQMIVMDATYPAGLVQSISHEIMHAIDNRLEYVIETLGKEDASIYTKWEKLNPKKYDYKYSYVDKDGNEYNAYNNQKYTPTDEKSLDDVNNIYFLDYYANTFPIEDRARIFEYLMTADNELSYEFNSKHIKAKAELLCEMIRMAMPSVPKNEIMYWEKFIKADTTKTKK